MATVENWIDTDSLGAIYPFVGSEGFLAVVGIVFWIIWHIVQVRKENAEFAQDIENIKNQGGPGKVLEKEESREMSDTVGG